MSKDLPQNLKCVRQDLSDWVWHFTRRDGSPKETLEKILASKQILGGNNYCDSPAVCLTEMPLIEAIRQAPTLEKHSFQRMSNYGIGFKKEWVFSKGGRPVIYGTWDERDRLPPELLWRHCDLNLSMGVDFTWQREWRIPGQAVSFDVSDEPLVVLPTYDEAMELLCSDYCEDPIRDEVFVTIDWSFVSADKLAEALNPYDVEVNRCERG